jgi:chromosome partitioning protein
MAKTIAIMNMKGGVGKTTLSLNLAHVIARDRTKSVLFIDCDPQSNASSYAINEEDYKKHRQKKKTLYHVFDVSEKQPSIVSLQSHPTKPIHLKDLVHARNSNWGFDIIPSQLELSLVGRSARKPDNCIKLLIETMCSHYDYIFLDCPPTISIYTQTALLAADYYLIPTKPEALSTVGIPLLQGFLKEFSKTTGHSPVYIGTVFNMLDDRRKNDQQPVINSVFKNDPLNTFNGALHSNAVIVRTAEYNIPITHPRPFGKTRTSGFIRPIEEINAIAKEFESKISTL